MIAAAIEEQFCTLKLLPRMPQIFALPGTSDPPPGFNQTHLAGVQLLAQIVTDLLDYRMLRLTVGWRGH